QEMKEGKRDEATFWIHFQNMYLFIAYYAVRNENGEYQGVVEMVLDMKPLRELEGEKRLLDN
ncbi:MAG: PAS domain-containing protein, partial [Candidatus Kapaibacteriota bacterium]